MRRVWIFVEGTGDEDALEALFAAEFAAARAAGVPVLIRPQTGKWRLLTRFSTQVREVLMSAPEDVAFVIPDLYPPTERDQFAHSTGEDLIGAMRNHFDAEIRRNHPKLAADPRFMERLRLHCFQHDLEALALAHPEGIASVLRVAVGSLRLPLEAPEDVNHDRPPARHLEELFSTHGTGYRHGSHPADILRTASAATIAEKCPVRFKPLFDDLRRVLASDQ